MKQPALYILTILLSLSLISNNALAGDARKGKHVAQKCVACHDLTQQKKNKVGPYLWGIVGRPAGKVPGYRYSKAHLSAANKKGIFWDEVTLRVYLNNPKVFIPGNKTAFAGIKREIDLDNLVTYLSSLK
ncbi:c-type cytochrome [Candidatus Venteria ishoeyi]|uniref:Cytochrome c-550 n=1 Tax=Candidatus Venteria ishoeyi TaxID=1899563 RepID=A0A1H6FE95_9GAMM|nr:cytochrome c family protein [Candidatus Venteria ishoeyi]MDM8546927.1 cytochrome c family protein [Candidatus Venteria ishoeyi]SEH07486.1 Cytochrome c-550 precursor [Candidatus Venteria ishoeyi]